MHVQFISTSILYRLLMNDDCSECSIYNTKIKIWYSDWSDECLDFPRNSFFLTYNRILYTKSGPKVSAPYGFEIFFLSTLDLRVTIFEILNTFLKFKENLPNIWVKR